MRHPWEHDFPDAVVHCAWQPPPSQRNSKSPKGGPFLKLHPQYRQAKHDRDMQSAINIIEEVAKEQALIDLRAIAIRHGVTPRLIAPAATVDESKNALAIGYAQWLGRQMDWPVEERVFREKSQSKDREGAWFRMAHPSTFYGKIDTSAPYIIVDDVITLGGTLADLRSFIINKGGKAIAMSAIASHDGRHSQIKLSDVTRHSLEKRYGPDLSGFCLDVLGHSHDCLTHEEAQKLLGCAGYVELRANTQRERDKTIT